MSKDVGKRVRCRSAEEQLFLQSKLAEFRNGTVDKPLNKTKSKETKLEAEALVLSAWHPETKKVMDIEDFCTYHNLPYKSIKSYKLVSHTGTPYYNVAFKQEELFTEVDFDLIIEEAVKRNVKPLPICNTPSGESKVFNKVVISDIHIGMNPNPSDSSLYGGKWDRDELMSRADDLVLKTINNQTSDILIIEDLGDLADGWDGLTTRGGHKLPQNMTNKEVFDVGVDFKMRILNGLVKNFASITCHNITCDNHSGDFGYIINSGFKNIAEARFPNVEVNNHEKFLSHYFMGNHCFVITHGKDDKHMKFGFKIHLDAKQIEKIENYIRHHNIYNQCKYVHVCKGDSHQALFDMCSSDSWNYFNYPSFAPSSGWIQGNFSKGRSGFTWEEYSINHNERKSISFWFDWE
jgi:hypothetical protein